MDMAEAEKYLVFEVDGHIFSVDFKNVRQIVPAEKPESIPDFPDYVPGTFRFEEKYVPVIDLRRRFGYTPKEIGDRDCFIVTDTEKRAALLVDRIFGFEEKNPEQIQPAVELNRDASARFLVGEFTDQQGRECRLIDPDKVIRLGDEGIFEQHEE